MANKMTKSSTSKKHDEKLYDLKRRAIKSAQKKQSQEHMMSGSIGSGYTSDNLQREWRRARREDKEVRAELEAYQNEKGYDTIGNDDYSDDALHRLDAAKEEYLERSEERSIRKSRNKGK